MEFCATFLMKALKYFFAAKKTCQTDSKKCVPTHVGASLSHQ